MPRKKSKIKPGTIPPLLKSQKEKLRKQREEKQGRQGENILNRLRDEFRKSQKAKYSSGTTIRITGPENRAAAIGQSPAKAHSQPIRVTGPANRLEVLPKYNPKSSLPIRSTGSPRRYVMEGNITFFEFLEKIEKVV